MSENLDTIYALSSGAGRAAISVIRVSGAHVRNLLYQLVGDVPRPRNAVYREIRHAQSGEIIDSGIILFFPGPASFNGEDICEFHIHGSNAVIRRLLMVLSEMPGLRLAEPGEFSRRALYNGKMDLTQIEGLADLIEAETEFQRRNAQSHSRGMLAEFTANSRLEVLSLLALVEAQIDFSDESDVPESLALELRQRADALLGQIQRLIGTSGAGERLRNGWRVVIAGPVNSGKSALFNALCGRDAAIVSPFAGTTRDVNRAYLDFGGLPVVLMDVAGIRGTDDPIESIGIERAMAEIGNADLVIWAQAVGEAAVEPPAHERLVTITTKADLLDPDARRECVHICVSAVSDPGTDGLVNYIRARGVAEFGAAEDILISHERQRLALAGAAAGLARFEQSLVRGLEFAAADLREAAMGLERLAGRIDVEEVLGQIFARFCIGK